ncbi:RES domain-containing protein [Pelagibaculum spongiae]|uniref:RES domain-containing protein n=1 Tax=Pelagibaculum spongiae TaxID=2080658 RepID=A0A2V1H3R5_9GAMM|nr:RES domain-containing protein [Pelagibaculum spongiae]
MRMYRLTKKQYADAPFDSVGAKTFGGRWNSKGVQALYFAESESLCCLEVFVHVQNDPAMIELYDLYRIELAEDLIAQLDVADLPANWRAIPAGESTQKIGDQFLQEHTDFAALQVASTISPRDCNFLVNPNHPAAIAAFEQAEKLDFRFDLRIFK